MNYETWGNLVNHNKYTKTKSECKMHKIALISLNLKYEHCITLYKVTIIRFEGKYRCTLDMTKVCDLQFSLIICKFPITKYRRNIKLNKYHYSLLHHSHVKLID